MLNDMSHKVARFKTKMQVGETKISKACPVSFLIKVHVLTIVLMKLEAFFIGTYALHVSQEMAKPFLILRQNVRTNQRLQKTSSIGHQSTHWQKISK